MFSTILDYLFTALGFLIVAAITYGVVKAIYLRVSFVFKPYNQKVNELSRRRKKAIKEESYKDLQQVALEELWLGLYKSADINRISYSDSLTKNQRELDDMVYLNLSKRLKKEGFVLPNVHNVEEKAIAYEFLDDLLHKSETARAESPYAETFYSTDVHVKFYDEFIENGFGEWTDTSVKSGPKNWTVNTSYHALRPGENPVLKPLTGVFKELADNLPLVRIDAVAARKFAAGGYEVAI